jgi:hypothetical protein
MAREAVEALQHTALGRRRKIPIRVLALQPDRISRATVIYAARQAVTSLAGFVRASRPPLGRAEYDHFFILTLTDAKSNPSSTFTALRYCDSHEVIKCSRFS